jgi:large subunit ribosomal protein L21
MSYAVIRTGGKQYLVSPGETITIEKIKDNGLKEGSKIVFDQVLLVGDDEKIKIGKPLVEGATVEGTLVKAGRARKIIVIHFRSKARERKKAGHRQPYFKVKIEAIK